MYSLLTFPSFIILNNLVIPDNPYITIPTFSGNIIPFYIVAMVVNLPLGCIAFLFIMWLKEDNEDTRKKAFIAMLARTGVTIVSGLWMIFGSVIIMGKSPYNYAISKDIEK